MTVRTQIFLDAELHAKARARAAALGISVAEYMRRLVDQDLAGTLSRESDHTDTAGDKPALAVPAVGCDPDWRERIEIAKRAHEDGKKARKGKPITFSMSRPLKFGDQSNS